MKKIILLAVVFLTIVSCKEDKEFNTPSFEGTKNNVRWSAAGQVAFSDEDGNFNIKAEIGPEVIVLTVPSRTVDSYDLTNTSAAFATFTDLDGTFYSTKNEPDETLTVYPLGGTIIVDEISVEGSSASGRFQFSAFTSDGLKGITFSGDAKRDTETVRYGVFYRVNVVGGVSAVSTYNELACFQAFGVTNSALGTYIATPNTDPVFATVCETYKSALESQVALCIGDMKLNAQIALTEIECAPANVCDIALAVAIEQKNRFEAVISTDPNYNTLCMNYRTALEKVIALCTGTVVTDATAALAALPC